LNTRSAPGARLERRLGAERTRNVYPLRAFADAGVLVGGASDAPVEVADGRHRRGGEPRALAKPVG
jgi:predicted amidohydrolase YtcJ